MMKQLLNPLALFFFVAHLPLLHAQEAATLLPKPPSFSKSIADEQAGGNPSLLHLERNCLNLPSLNLDVNNNAFSFSQMVVAIEGENYLSFRNILPLALPKNQLNLRFNIPTVGFSKGFGNWAIGVHYALRSYVSSEVNENLLQLLGKGNAQFVGQTIDIQGNMYAAIYAELGLSAAYKVHPNWTIGARLKKLNGVTGLFATGNGTLLTDTAHYQLKMNNNYIVKTYGMTSNSPASSRFFSGDGGFAVDLGATYADEKTTVSIGLEDIGSIGWSKNANNTSVTGQATYAGLQTNAFFQFDSLNSTFFKDTLKKVLHLTNNTDATTEALPFRITANAFYRLANGYEIGTNLYFEALHGINNYGIALVGMKQITPSWKVGLRYSIRNNSFSNVGIQTNMDFKKVHIFASTDNMITALSAMSAKQAAVRIGINVLF
jgi:hypothetical protein